MGGTTVGDSIDQFVQRIRDANTAFQGTNPFGQGDPSGASPFGGGPFLGGLLGRLAGQANQFGDTSGFGGSSLFGLVSPLSFLGGFNNDPFLGARIQDEVARQGGGADITGLLGMGPTAGNVGGPQAGGRGLIPGIAGAIKGFSGAPGGSIFNQLPKNLPAFGGGFGGVGLGGFGINFDDLKKRILLGSQGGLGGSVAPSNSGSVGGFVNTSPGNILSGIAGQTASAIPAQQTNTGGKDISGSFGSGIRL